MYFKSRIGSVSFEESSVILFFLKNSLESERLKKNKWNRVLEKNFQKLLELWTISKDKNIIRSSENLVVLIPTNRCRNGCASPFRFILITYNVLLDQSQFYFYTSIFIIIIYKKLLWGISIDWIWKCYIRVNMTQCLGIYHVQLLQLQCPCRRQDLLHSSMLT